ncbi:hypothetical protein [Clostridium thermosuccinogenes]|uniref:hypothetical protein n=1 Tax=Clostridium thermosuccinogenes TaxID=84032 RepID=UPI000CCC4267|nr:hypothetical protein [Pseudoclostridium thermosuccinogenes]PNT90388.1 hypothetical protein CDQ83_19210 [Pseudoclostridium thermosuccinogenes]
MLLFKKSLFVILLLLLLLVAAIAPVCYANSAEPPSIVIIVPGVKKDVEISIGSGDIFSKASKTVKAFESYYVFYNRDLKADGDYTLKITTEGTTYEIEMNDKPLKNYNNIYTLNLKNKTLTRGKSTLRSVLLVSFRLILTLFMEAGVFTLFRYKEKRSWIAFLIINLISQGVLNIWLNTASPLGSYLILLLIFGEIFVFIFEIFAFLLTVKERKAAITASYVIVANLLSLAAGGYIITYLPI